MFSFPILCCRQQRAGQGSRCWLRSAQHVKPWRRRSSVSWRKCRERRSGWSSVFSRREPTGARLWRVWRKHAPVWCTSWHTLQMHSWWWGTGAIVTVRGISGMMEPRFLKNRNQCSNNSGTIMVINYWTMSKPERVISFSLSCFSDLCSGHSWKVIFYKMACPCENVLFHAQTRDLKSPFQSYVSLCQGGGGRRCRRALWHRQAQSEPRLQWQQVAERSVGHCSTARTKRFVQIHSTVHHPRSSMQTILWVINVIIDNHYDKYLQTLSHCSPVIRNIAVSQVSGKTSLRSMELVASEQRESVTSQNVIISIDALSQH